jgi:hypothetical protein
MTATHKHHQNFAQAQDEVNTRGGMWKDGERLAKLEKYKDHHTGTDTCDAALRDGGKDND